MVYYAGTDLAFEERTICERPIYIQAPHTRDCSLKAGVIRSDFGRRSLEEMAIRVAVAHAKNLTKTTLENVPWHVAHKIWKELQYVFPSKTQRQISDQRCSPIPLPVWKTFTSIYAQQASEGDFLDVLIILSGMFSLPQCLETGTAWLTELHIQINHISYQDMIGLSNMPSLAVLALHSPFTSHRERTSIVDDRLIRAWARSAEETDGFANLRIISFHGCQHFSVRWLGNMCLFPILQWVFSHIYHYEPKGGSSRMRPNNPADHKGWILHDIEKESNPNNRPSDPFIEAVYSVARNAKCLWSEWYQHKLRRLQVEELGSLPASNLYIDHRKPILSILHGKQSSVGSYPLAYRRMKHPTTSGSIQIRSLATSEQTPQIQVAEMSYKRQIKKRKFNDIDDFAQMLG